MASKNKENQKKNVNLLKTTKNNKNINDINNKNNNKNDNKKDDNEITITDDKMINKILGNIGKKSKNINKKELINNFIENKKINNKNEQEQKKEQEPKQEINKKTYTENLTKEEINEKLEDYKLVDDISKVPLDTHLRYFIKKDGEMLFRMGGNLKRNLDLPNYVVLKNALGTEWTVQVKDTLFYKKMSIKEIKEEYDGIINDLHNKIKKLKTKIKELEK